MRIAKDPRALIWSLVILGLAWVAPGCARHSGQQDAVNPGPRPDRTLMYFAIYSAAGRTPDSPANLDDLEVQQPFIDPKEDSCWQVPFRYQSQFGRGEVAIFHGVFAVKQGRLLRAQWNSGKAGGR